MGSVNHATLLIPNTFNTAFTSPKSLFSIHAHTIDTATIDVTNGKKYMLWKNFLSKMLEFKRTANSNEIPIDNGAAKITNLHVFFIANKKSGSSNTLMKLSVPH